MIDRCVFFISLDQVDLVDPNIAMIDLSAQYLTPLITQIYSFEAQSGYDDLNTFRFDFAYTFCPKI